MKRMHVLNTKGKLRHIQEPLQTARLLGKMVWKSGPWLMICMLFFILIEATVPLLQLYASKQVIDGVVKHDNAVNTEVWAVVYAGSLVMVGAVKSLETWVKTLLSERSMITVNTLLIDAFERIPGMRFFEDPAYRDKLETLRDRSTWLPSQFVNISSNLLTAVVSLFGVVFVIAYLSPILAVILFLSTAPFAFVHNRYNEMEWEYHKNYAPARRRITYARNILLNRRSAKEIRLFGLGPFFQTIYRSTFKELYSVLQNIQVRSSRWAVLTGFISGAGTGMGYFWILSQSGSHHVTPGDIALYLGAVFQLSAALRDIAKEGADTFDIWRMGKDFFLFMNAKKDIAPPVKPVPLGEKGALAVEFKNVSFRYPFMDEDHKNSRSDNVLNDISFSIAPGERIAVVGANGSGKTTLIKLLCRFYELNSGEIKVNGVNIRNAAIKDVRSRISVVFQKFGKYELSLRENIALGDLDAANDQEKLQHAVQAARLEQIIETLPEGLDARLGPEWGGTDFSGRQWQRIALARSFIKDASLVILDEPAASLDIRAEYEIFRQFHRFTQGKSVIMISHRFSTVKMADRILVLKNGKIEEEGSHEELMKQNGEYANMFRLQAKSYQGKDEVQC
ncbi:ABC transporter ATP-binding protein [Bacillus subtilis]